MKKFIFYTLILFPFIINAQGNENKKKGRIIDSNNKPVKNVYIINSECKVIDISNKKGSFTFTGNIIDFVFVKKGMEKITYEIEKDISTIYMKKNIKETTGKTTNFLGVYPTRNIQVNGLALNLITDFEDGTERSTLTNGIEIDIDALSAMLTFMPYINISSKNLHSEPNHCLADYKLIKKINGINLNILSMNPMITNGIYFGTSINPKNITSGLSCSLLTNQNTKINGISLSVFGNHDVSCNGIQIGLFNSSSNLKGFQFGLWNKNQKRSLPFINWNFKD